MIIEQQSKPEEKNILLRHMELEGETCPSEDHILDYAMKYKLSGIYPPSLTKEKKRAVRKEHQH